MDLEPNRTLWKKHKVLAPARNQTTAPRISTPYPSHFTNYVISTPPTAEDIHENHALVGTRNPRDHYHHRQRLCLFECATSEIGTNNSHINKIRNLH